MWRAENYLLIAILAAALPLGSIDCVMLSAQASAVCERVASRCETACGSGCEEPEKEAARTPDCPVVACVMVQRPLLRRWPPDVRAEQRALEPAEPAFAASTDLSRPIAVSTVLGNRHRASAPDPPTLLQLGCMLLE
jgi:hypothetical protein